MLEILERAPGVKPLVTAREALNLQEEWVFKVRGLAFPGTEQTEGLDQYDAVALFIQRAGRGSPGLVFDEADLAGIPDGDASAPVPPSQLDARSVASPATTQSASPTA